MTFSLGLMNISAYNQDLTAVVIFVISITLKSTQCVLNQTFERPYWFMDQLLMLKCINFPIFQWFDVLVTLFWALSPFTFLVSVQVTRSSTTTIYRRSGRVIYGHGISVCSRVPRHLASGRNLHFWDAGFLWNLQPEALSKRAMALSISVNSLMQVTAGFTSSAYPITLYLSSYGANGKELGRKGPWTESDDMRMPFNLFSR